MAHKRRLVAALAVPLIALGASTLPAGPPAVAGSDPEPGTTPVQWSEDWVVYSDTYIASGDDAAAIGRIVDAAMSVAAVGPDDYEPMFLTKVSGQLAARVDDFVGDGTTTSYAGALARAAILAREAGDDPSAYGGVDLVSRLEQRVQTSGAVAGRVEDLSPDGDHADVLDQVYAVRALDEAGSNDAAAATSYLLEQQCAGGAFRAAFSAPTATTQTCDGDASAADVDTTARAVLELEQETSDPAVASAVSAAVAYLQRVQHANGSFGDPIPSAVADATSTGLAGWALGDRGATAAAAKAAVWVRGLQAADDTTCGTQFGQPDYEGYPIAPDAAALEAARKDRSVNAGTFTETTAAAFPVLQWAPTVTGPGHVTPGTEFVRAGSRLDVSVSHLAPGTTVCFKEGTRKYGVDRFLVVAGADGVAHAPSRTPKGGDVHVSDVGRTIAHGYSVLGPQRFHLQVPHRVRRGRTVAVHVHYLEPGEPVTVYLRGHRVAHGRAVNPRDPYTFVARVRIRGPLGHARISARGRFGDRVGHVRVAVVR